MGKKQRPRVRLTKASVEAATDHWTYDTEIPGFILEVRGDLRTYWLKYAIPGKGVSKTIRPGETEPRKWNRSRWVRIGHHGAEWRPDPSTGKPRDLTAELAREEARRLRGIANDGRDPAAERDLARGTPTVAEFAETYLEDHARPHKGAATAAGDERNLRKVIIPAIGKLRLDRVDGGAVAKMHAARRKTPFNANRCLALLSHMVTMAVTWGVLPKGHPNPCEDIPRYPEPKRKRWLDADELGRVGAALEACEARWRARRETPFADRVEDESVVSPAAGLAIQLMLLTGARASEILGLRWQDVHGPQGLAMRPRKGSGEEVRPIYLPPQAVALIDAQKPTKGNPHVIPGRRRGRPLTLSGLEQAWQTVRAAAALRNVRLHDLRHTFASVVVQGGGSLPHVGGLLDHTQASTTQRYAHLAAGPLRDLAASAGETIAEAMKRR